jgi:phosphotriesterase-related protein
LYKTVVVADDARVMTVLGPLAADELGVVLPHEHLLIDTTVCYWQEPADGSSVADAHEPVEITKLGLLRRNLFALRDNLVLDDPELAVAELAAFRELGGNTVVDLTLPDIGRDPLALQEIARRSGVQIVMGCGHYIHLAHPQTLGDEPLEAIAERLIMELTEGVGDTRVRPGIIGEIGTWHPLNRNEEKVLRAAARAQRATGVALTIHLHVAARDGHEVLTILEQEGIDLSRVVLGHVDIAFGHLDTDLEEVLDYHRSLAARGAFIEYDTCGAEVYAPGGGDVPPFWTALDLTRARAIVRLFDEGLGDRLLISHDVFTKSQLLRYGGFGYAHILRDFQHRLREVGLGDAEVEQLLRDNPRRMLTPAR